MLGLGLVVGVIALLLTGTLHGLLSFRATMRSIDSKLEELRAAENFKNDVNAILSSSDLAAGTPDELPRLQTAIQNARRALDAYEEKLQDTILHRRDPDRGHEERGVVEALRGYFADLEQAVREAALPSAGHDAGLSEQAAVKHAVESLVRTAGDLRDAIYRDMARRSIKAKDSYKVSMWTVVSISVGGVLLLAGLLKFFYGWVFYPIRDLEQGAGRVAQGDFAHRIEVHSGDELEDLAAAFNDMTSRLREMYRDLERQVNERSQQLVRSEQIVHASFLAMGVAHEINNPLASIALCSESLEQRLRGILTGTANGLAPQDREVVAKYLRMIQDESQRCKSITLRLLEFCRTCDRKRQQANLAEIVQSVLEVVEHLGNARGKRIVFDPRRVVTAWVNTQEIKSVVLNLVVNALDSMDEGGTLTISLGQRDGQAVLRFSDTGCGMTADVLANIFEPFYTRSRTGKGTGLGLSISQRVVSSHGGEIEAASPGPNQGSTFTVRLPQLPPATTKEETLGQAAA
jgi:signal transduction histidine kinase